MLVGTVVGAGFASGREIWVYFGSFGAWGYVGLLAFIVGYVLTCIAGFKLSNKLGRNDFEAVIVPEGHKGLSKFVKTYMILVLWAVLICMTAAAGSVANQQFGIPKFIGGIIVVALVLFTIYGDFERVSKAFRFVMPFLMAIIIISCIAIIVLDLPETGYTNEVKHATLTPTWYISALLYFCFNMTGSLSVSIILGYRASEAKPVKRGIILTGAFCFLLGSLMITACLRDPSFAEAMDMPLMGFSGLISRPLNIAFVVVMMISIYSAATSNFYAYTTWLSDGPNKKKIIVASAVIAYAIGQAGFKNIVNYMFSIFGIVGIVILITLIWNYAINHERNTGND